MNTIRIQLQLKRAFEAMGIEVECRGSSLSEAKYLVGEFVKVRIAKHESKPTYDYLYGEPDFEVGSSFNKRLGWLQYTMNSDGDWLACIRWAAKRFGKKLPPWLKSLIKSQERAIANLRDKREVVDRECREHQERRESDWERAKRLSPELAKELESLKPGEDGLNCNKGACNKRKQLKRKIWLNWRK